MTSTTSKKTSAEEAAESGLSAKYLTFRLAGETYGLDILQVREIIGLLPVTRMPRMPEYARGVINLRGKVIPVVDLRLKFGMKMAEATSETCIIVVNIEDVTGDYLVGVLVDSVSEVLDINERDIDPAPELDESIELDFISGIGKSGEKVIILLDIMKIINTSSLDKIK